MQCSECGFEVITCGPTEATCRYALGRELSAGANVDQAEVLKCPISDWWHVVPLGGTGQLDMLREIA